MHIAILAPTHKSFISDFLPNETLAELPDGIASAPFVGILIEELLNLNYSVTAITLTQAINGDYTTKSFKSHNFEWIVVPFRPHSIRFNGNKIGRILDFYRFEIREMTRCIKKIKPDIVHAHWSYEYAGAALNCSIPHLITIHDNAIKVLFFFKNIYRLGRLFMSELFLRKARFVSTVSPYMWDYTISRCKNAQIIPNPTRFNLDYQIIKSQILEKSNSLITSRIIMINNGWDNRKNGLNALIAFQLLKINMPNVSLHLFGQGSELGGPAYDDANSIGLESINYYGIVPHKKLLEELSNSHLLLHSSLEESFGVILIEAMSLGVPAIGGKKSGAVPWVIDNDYLCVDVTNPREIANKIYDILIDNKLYQSVAISGFSNVLNRFSSKIVVRKYLEYYEKILKKN